MNHKYIKLAITGLTVLLLFYLIFYLFHSFDRRTDRMKAKPTVALPTLRDLASKEGISIGAVVNSNYLGKDRMYQKILSREVNMVTPENEMKFDFIHPGKDRFDFSKADEIVNFALKNHQKVRGHTLVWFHRIPEWLKKGRYSRAEMMDLLKNHIQTVVGHYKGKVYSWDVVNEALDDRGRLRDSIWLRTIGPEYIPLAFLWAHEADPEALLFYNDYGIDGMNRKSDALYKLLKKFRNNHVPINGVGYEMHSWISSGINFNDEKKSINRLGSLHLQVQITELDIGMAEPVHSSLVSRSNKQAEYYADTLKTCLSTKSCSAVVMWGITDKYTYRNQVERPLIFNNQYQPKRAYWSLLQTLRNNQHKP